MTADEVRALIDYDPATGAFQWKARLNTYFNGRNLGASVGTKRKDGYLQISLNGKLYLAHRLAWLIVHGELPPDHTDHINGNRSDNRIENLRIANKQENAQNAKVYSTNSSGYPGVSIDRSTNLWRARITFKRKEFYLGSHKTKEEAYQAYLDAKAKHHQFQPYPRKAA